MPGSPETTWILPAFLAPHRTPPAHASLNPANRLPCRSPFGEYLTRFALLALDQNARRSNCAALLFHGDNLGLQIVDRGVILLAQAGHVAGKLGVADLGIRNLAVLHFFADRITPPRIRSELRFCLLPCISHAHAPCRAKLSKISEFVVIVIGQLNRRQEKAEKSLVGRHQSTTINDGVHLPPTPTSPSVNGRFTPAP